MRALFEWKQMGVCLLDKSQDISTSDNFWIKDHYKALGIDIIHCPTLSMLADFFTKPLNGSLYWKFRDVILGYKYVSSLGEILPTDVEKCVGNNNDLM